MGHRHEGTCDLPLDIVEEDRGAANLNHSASKQPAKEEASSNSAKMATKLMNGKTSQSQPPVTRTVELDIVKQIARYLAYDIVYYVSNLKKLRPSSNHARTLRRTVDELSERHQMVFNGMLTKLQVSEENGQEIFENVTDEMFRDGQINWGRLATVYALAGRLAKHCAEKNMVDFVDRIAEFTGDYVSTHLAEWIHRQGGWNMFDEFFPEQANTENTLWRGLLYMGLGLGALATMAAVR